MLPVLTGASAGRVETIWRFRPYTGLLVSSETGTGRAQETTKIFRGPEALRRVGGLLRWQVMFFANMGAILSYGLLGTLISFFLISVGVSAAFQIMNFDSLYDEGPSLRDTLTLGATFCATDSIAILQILMATDRRSRGCDR